MVQDSDDDSAILSFTITVEADTEPSFGAEQIANLTYTKDEAIAALTLPAATGGNGTVLYGLYPVPDGLSFDDATRTLTGTPTTAKAYDVTYTAQDADNDSVTLSFIITVEDLSSIDTEPSFGAEQIANLTYTKDVAITALTLPSATGGNGTVLYGLWPVPDGLSFDGATRTLTGTPTTAQTLSVTYTAQDADNDSVTLSFTITVEPDTEPSFGAEQIANQTYTKDVAISPLTLPSATGGNGTVLYGLWPVPDGLSFDGATRTLTGTPTQAQTYNVTYTAQDADNDSVTLSFTITVEELSAQGKLAAAGLPDAPQLHQNMPNPFNSQTVLSYILPKPGLVRMEILTLTGQRVAVLRQGQQEAGYHRLSWNGRDDTGRPLASGVYLYRLVTTEGVLTRKLVLLR